MNKWSVNKGCKETGTRNERGDEQRMREEMNKKFMTCEQEMKGM